MVRAGRQPLYNAWHVQRLHSVVVSAWPPLPVRSEGVVCLTPLHQSKRAPHRLAPSMRAGEEACDMFGAPAMSFSPGVLTPAATHTELSAVMLTTQRDATHTLLHWMRAVGTHCPVARAWRRWTQHTANCAPPGQSCAHESHLLESSAVQMLSAVLVRIVVLVQLARGK